MIGRDADIDVCAQRKLLGAANTKWQFRARDKRMIGKELVQDPVRESQAVKIVLTEQDEIMELGQRIDQTRFGIETSEIKTVVAVVVKELLPHVDEGVERPRDARLVKDARGRRHQKIAAHPSVCQGHVGRVIKRRRDRRGERLIFLHSLENLLLAQVRIIRARRGLTLLHAIWRNLRSE